MARMVRSLAVMGLVVVIGLALSAATDARFVAPEQDPQPKTTVKKKTKTAPKKGMPADDAKAVPAAPADGQLKFSRDIAPILVANCGNCHNPQGRAFPKSKLSMSNFDGLMKGGNTGPPIVAGSPEESLLVQRIHGENGPKMPPGQANLGDTAKNKIAMWIKDGAKLDSGVDANAPMAKYAASPEDIRKAELAKMSTSDRDKKTAATALDRLKKADPAANPEMTSSAHFLLFGEMPKDRATNLLKVMEAQYGKLARLLPNGKGLVGPEKIGLYVFKQRKGYTEFVRTVENQEVDNSDEARAKLNVESPYVLAVDPVAGGAEPSSSSSKKGGRSKKATDDAPSGPERALAGLLTEQLTSSALTGAGKPPRWVTAGVGALFASHVEPRSPYYRRLRAAAYEQCRLDWPTKATEALGDQTKPETVRAIGFAISEWMFSTDASAFTEFVHAILEGGEKLDAVIAGCLGGATREQFLAVTGAYVAEHYASMR
jgi:cytochrome c553